MRHLAIRLKMALLLGAVWFTTPVYSYQVLVSLNTYKKSKVEDALSRVDELKSDGAWINTNNSDFTDSEWKSILDTLGGIQITEDKPDQNQSYVNYVRIMGREPNGSFCYNETGGKPGGTQLTDDQIDTQYASHGGKPIIVLTRSYGGKWKTETDRCLSNPKVDGLCMEYVKKALLLNINAPANAIKAAAKQNKPVFVLLHAGDGWTLEENKQIIENLNKWSPEEMKRDDLYLVYQCYHCDSDAWFGKEGVKAAIQQARSMPNYRINTSRQHGNKPDTAGAVQSPVGDIQGVAPDE